MLVDITTALHTSTQRDYFARMANDKVHCSETAKLFDYDYWDGDRKYGYGGYRYDGRWNVVAKKIIEYYGINSRSKVLDIGCGKGYLLYEIKKEMPGITISGIDISQYAIENAKDEIKPFIQQGKAQVLPFSDNSYDLAISITTLHNLYLPDLYSALKEVNRVSRKSFITVESYRNEQEKYNLMCWQLTCECFFTPLEWEFIFRQCGWGDERDYEFIFFE